MKRGDTVTLIDHLPLFTGAGLRAGSRWRVDQVHPQQRTVNLASLISGAIVACCIPMSRLIVEKPEVIAVVVEPVAVPVAVLAPAPQRELAALVSDEDF